MLARERPTIPDYKIRGLFLETAERGDTWLRGKVEIEARVEACLAKVAVERPTKVEAIHEGAQAAQIVTEALGRHGGILPPRPRHTNTWHECGAAKTGLAYLPNLLLLAWVAEQAHARRARATAQCVHQRLRIVAGLGAVVAAELHQQPPATLRQQCHIVDEELLAGDVLDQPVIEPLQADGTVRHDLRRMVGRLGHIPIAKHQ